MIDAWFRAPKNLEIKREGPAWLQKAVLKVLQNRYEDFQGDEQYLTVLEINEIVKTERQSVNRTLQNLRKKGLVEVQSELVSHFKRYRLRYCDITTKPSDTNL